MINKSLIMAAAIAGMSIAANAEDKKTTEWPKDKPGQCHGVNSCKGQGACHSKTNSCAGSNSCKGQGWMKMTKKECDEKKGNFVGKKASM